MMTQRRQHIGVVCLVARNAVRMYSLHYTCTKWLVIAAPPTPDTVSIVGYICAMLYISYLCNMFMPPWSTSKEFFVNIRPNIVYVQMK